MGRNELAAAFWDQVDTNGDCWLWMGKLDAYTYGTFTFEKHTYATHRLAYELGNGQIARGLLVCHSCDMPPCCNPAHLWLGTHADNLHDAMSKGRHQGKRKVLGPWDNRVQRIRGIVDARRKQRG